MLKTIFSIFISMWCILAMFYFPGHIKNLMKEPVSVGVILLFGVLLMIIFSKGEDKD